MSERSQMVDWIPRLRRYALSLVHDDGVANYLVQKTLEHPLLRADLRSGLTDRAELFGLFHDVFSNDKRHDIHLSVRQMLGTFWTNSETHLREQIFDIETALKYLPVEQRQVVLLVGLEEMTYAEAALTLEIPVETVKSQLHRGREKLRQLLS